MKKRYLLLLALGTYLATAVVLFPAAPVLAQLNTQPLRILGVDGSLWSGQAARVQAPDAPPIDDVSWRLQPLKLFTGAAGAKLNFSVLGGHGNADVAQSFGGDTVIGPGTLKFPASGIEPLLPLPIAKFQGAVQVDLQEAVLQQQKLQRLQGLVIWRKARLLSPAEADLGEVRLDVAPEGEGHRGTLSNNGGHLDIRGNLRLDNKGLARVDITLKPRNNAPQSLRDSLNLLGRPGADGSWRIRQQARLNDLL